MKFRVHSGDGTNVSDEPINEIEEYWSGRYLAATEAVWRILGYNITQKSPSVTVLPIHLPDSLCHQRYQRSDPSPTLSNLEHYFARPTGMFLNETNERNFQDLCYIDYFSLFRLHKFQKHDVGKPGFFLENHNN